MRIGVNSRMIRELSSCGKLRASEVDLIEISLAEIDFVIFQRWIESTASTLRENYGADFTVHAPYQNSAVDYLRINFAERKEENMKIFSKVLEVAERIEADTIVVHPGDQTSRNSFKNAVENLRTASRIASDYSINIVVENVYTSENAVLEIKNASKDEIVHSLAFLKGERLEVIV